MSHPATLDKYSKLLYSNESLGFYLDLHHANLKVSDLNRTTPMLEAALRDMEALESGSIANPDEQRQVGHYWLRHPQMAPTVELSQQINQTLDDIESFAANVLAGKHCAPSGKPFSQLLVIGIGGSALGPQFLADALDPKTGLKIHFLDNTDPDGIDRVLTEIAPAIRETLVLVISKSGGTAETRNGMLETQRFFRQKGLNFDQQSVAITGTGSQLHQRATDESWLATFPMWDWVGGRTSVTSAVGLLPAALLGIDIRALLKGAAAMDEITRRPDVENNPAARLAQAWYLLGEGRGSKDMVILPYKDRLLLFSRYLQQLIMESLGKRLDLDGNTVHQGIAVYGNKGSTDQHAYVQQLRDGLNNFFVTFIEVLQDRHGESMLVDDKNTTGDYLFGFYQGTQQALSESDRRSITISIPAVTPGSIGSLIALYERAVGFYASLININAYHQPGVEAGKKAAGDVLMVKNQVLELLASSPDPMDITEISTALGLSGREILIYHIVRHCAANDTMQVKGSLGEPATLKVSV